MQSGVASAGGSGIATNFRVSSTARIGLAHRYLGGASDLARNRIRCPHQAFSRLVAPTIMWEIGRNSVGSGSDRNTVRPGQPSYVVSPPPLGCRQNWTYSL